MEKAYIEIVRLLLEVAPCIFRTPSFALKGGTALNLFVREMPRLSVDIDVVYTDHTKERVEVLQEIAAGLSAAQEELAGIGIGSKIIDTNDAHEVKLLAHRGKSQVKVEVNYNFRGTILPVRAQRLAKTVRDLFTTDLTVPMLAVSELYGSKLVAALDRQHPRDFYDIRGMYQHTGLDAEIVESFVCYLAGHNRPIHEVLFSHDKDMEQAFNDEFSGITSNMVTLPELVSTRERLRRDLPSALTGAHRKFLLGLAAAQPDWSLMVCPHLQALPAIRWKLQNLARLKKTNPAKFTLQTEELKTHFSA